MKKIFLFIAALCCAVTINATEGALSGEFSVSATKKVHFSKGNLQFNAQEGTHQCADGTTQKGTWRFAETQWECWGWYEYIQFTSSYNGWIDLFGWGTSGWNSGANAYLPYSTSSEFGDYYPGGSDSNDLTGEYANADWGVYNQIGEDAPGSWRTLTTDEWEYLLHGRTDADSLFGFGTVYGRTGLIILPDNWEDPKPSGIIFKPSTQNGLEWQGSQYYNSDGKNFTHNKYIDKTWSAMEKAGAVFLPAAGYRRERKVNGVDYLGSYWSSTHDKGSFAWFIDFTAYRLKPQESGARSLGYSVRLVQDVIEPEPLVTKTLTGRFAVSETESVTFAQGNLQYTASSDTWQFANNQYRMLGENNKEASSTYSGTIDLFGFGTSSVAAKPWETSKTASVYAIPSEITGTIAGTDYDWTHYNTIANDGGYAWRLLSVAEWEYLLNTRAEAATKQGQVVINDIKGCILLPDNWTCPEGLSFTPKPNNFTANVYTFEQWKQLEEAGAVFLPATGYRYGTSMMAQGNGQAFYWTGDFGDNSTAKVLSISGTNKPNIIDAARPNGCPIRPVRKASLTDGIEDVQRDNVQSTKVIRDDQLYILRDGKVYNATGAEVK